MAPSHAKRIQKLEEQVDLLNRCVAELNELRQQDAVRQQQEVVRQLVTRAAPFLGKLAGQFVAARAANDVKERKNGAGQENPGRAETDGDSAGHGDSD
jgi:TolA-binding protein